MIPVLSSGAPLYQQVRDYLKKRIEAGELLPHAQIPSERELCELFQLSRTTVRQALGEAEREGLIYRIHGKGTFVSSSQINQPLSEIHSFKETVTSHGLRPQMQVLSTKILAADFQLAALLKIDVDSEIVNIELLGYANDEPLVWYSTFLAGEMGREVAEEARIRTGNGLAFSTYELYMERCGIRPDVTNQTIEVRLADEVTASRLQIEPGAAHFLVTSIVYDEDGRPIEFKKTRYRGDRYKVNISRKHHYRD